MLEIIKFLCYAKQNEIVQEVIMASRWSRHADYIVCKYTYEHIFKGDAIEPQDSLMLELQEHGFGAISETAVNKRSHDYLSLFRGSESQNFPRQVLSIYQAFLDRIDNPSRYESIKSYILKTFEPNNSLNTFADEDALTSIIGGKQKNHSHYIHSIDYGITFPMVLQKFIEQKGFKKHKDIYDAISMKQDTFSSILRGKYTVVKKENVLRLCIGLKLSIEEAEELMASAGYLFSRGIMTDVVVKAHIIHHCYIPERIDAELDENNVATLFSLA
jgi:hypothetical protein